jgi:thiamine-monophosphate kinase
MDEFELINRFFATDRVVRADVDLGIGDDGALTTMAGSGAGLVLATDTIVSGVHFPPGISPACIGHRALAVNLSDLAAMGAEPAWALLALTTPSVDERWLAGFAEGLLDLAAMHAVALIGGDTTRGDTLTITVTAVGLVPPALAIRRSGARAGDLVCVTGTPGDAAAGLDLARQSDPDGVDTRDTSVEAWLRHRFLRPVPRVSCGLRLREHASAAIDISDGLLADAHKLASASGVRIEIDVAQLPCSPSLLSWAGRPRAEALALLGGDDYELLFTLPPAYSGRLVELAQACGAQLTMIGRVRAAEDALPSGAVALRDGRPIDLDTAGYRHFR